MEDNAAGTISAVPAQKGLEHHTEYLGARIIPETPHGNSSLLAQLSGNPFLTAVESLMSTLSPFTESNLGIRAC